MGRTFPIHLQMPDGSLFQGDAPIRGGAAAWADFVLMAWLHPPDRALDAVLADLVRQRDDHENAHAPWLARLERALETQRFNGFWVYAPSARSVGLPDSVPRAEVARAYRLQEQQDGGRIPFGLHGLYEDLSREPGCERIGDLRSEFGWSQEFLKQQFEQQVARSRSWMLGPRRNLPQRRKAASRAHAWFASHHGAWMAIEAHRNFLNPTPEEALGRLPSFNQAFNGNAFYRHPSEAFLWLGTIKIDNPAEADWQITPHNQPARIPEEPLELLAEAPTDGVGRFLFSVLVDDVDLQDPAAAVGQALQSAGLRFAIRRFQQVGGD